MKERTPYQKQNYEANKKRVFEIYGDRNIIPEPYPIIEKKDRKKYSMHHIVFRKEGGTDIKSNLCPLLKEVHCDLHIKIDEQEGYIPEKTCRKQRNICRNRQTHRKRHRHHRKR